MASTFVSTHADLPHRPTMRRKSSAQNLLASFKTSPNQTPLLNPISTNIAPNAPYANVPTPATSVFLGRDPDTQTMRSDTVVSSPALSQGTSVEYLRDLVQKRIITLTYIRSIHEGCVYQATIRLGLIESVTGQTEPLVSYHLDDTSRLGSSLQ
jgi:hypothetical protein